MNAEKKPRFLEEDLQRLRGLRLLDDDFMKVFFDGNIEATTLLLNIFFGRDDMVVTEVIGQREVKNVGGRSVRLDILAKDSTGKVYDIEVQRADKGASAQRARFNSAMLDTQLLAAGEDFDKLVDTYVILITENDVIGKGLPLYEIDRYIKQTHELFGDGSHILYVNGAYQNNESQIGKLMHDFRCVEPEDMNFPLLADRARYFKESEGGREIMCKMMEDMRNEAAKAADYARRVQTAKNLLVIGKLSYDEIAQCSDLTIDEVKALDEKKSA